MVVAADQKEQLNFKQKKLTLELKYLKQAHTKQKLRYKTKS